MGPLTESGPWAGRTGFAAPVLARVLLPRTSPQRSNRRPLDGTVRLWDPDTEATVHELSGHTSGVEAVAFGTTTAGRTLLVSGSDDRTVRLWDPDVGDCLTTILRRAPVIALAANGSQLAIGDDEGVVVIKFAADTLQASEFGWP